MANCNDCICSEVCYYKAFNDERILKKRRDDVEKNCKSFVHRDSLKNAPTVYAVEVVRCENCRKRHTWECAMHYESEDGKEQYGWENDNDFCSWGERKDGDGNG